MRQWNRGAGVVLVAALLIFAALIFAGCGPRPDTPESTQAWEDVQKQLDRDLPGQSITQLRTFLLLWKNYQVGLEAQKEIDTIAAGLDDTLNRALDRARQGEIKGATATLEDIARHFRNDAVGKTARAQLAYDVPMMHARSLLMKHRVEEAKPILQELLAANPSGVRAAEINALLNNIQLVGLAELQADSAHMRAAAAKIRMQLAVQIANDGSAPLTFGDMDLAKISDGAAWLNQSVEVESYAPSGSNFRLVIKPKSGSGERWEITSETMKALP